MCHANPDPGWTMRIAPASVCIQRHSAIKPDSPAIQKLAEYARTGREIPWVRVYEVPGYVYLSHRAECHRVKKARFDCNYCHGRRR